MKGAVCHCRKQSDTAEFRPCKLLNVARYCRPLLLETRLSRGVCVRVRACVRVIDLDLCAMPFEQQLNIASSQA